MTGVDVAKGVSDNWRCRVAQADGHLVMLVMKFTVLMATKGARNRSLRRRKGKEHTNKKSTLRPTCSSSRIRNTIFGSIRSRSGAIAALSSDPWFVVPGGTCGDKRRAQVRLNSREHGRYHAGGEREKVAAPVAAAAWDARTSIGTAHSQSTPRPTW